MRIMPRRKVELSLGEIITAFIRAFFSVKAERHAFAGQFEKRFADFIGVRYAMAFPSVRAGMALFFECGCFAKGDEIILPSFNYHVVPAVLAHKGLKPIFADVNPATWTIDPVDVERKITDKTKGVIALHVFGQSCAMDALRDLCRRYHLFLIEDAAHACGGTYHRKKLGSLGDGAFFSFGTGKALVAFGGAMLTTDSEEIFLRITERINALTLPSGVLGVKSFFGSFAETVLTGRVVFSYFVYPLLWIISLFHPDFADVLTEDKYVFEEGNVTLRSLSLSPFQACLALSQLEKLEELNRRREKWAALLTELLKDCPAVQIHYQGGHDEHIGLYYSIAVPDPEALRKFLFSKGVDTKKGTMRACSALAFFEGSQTCPVAERTAPRLVELPCYPSLSEPDIYYQANLIREFYGKDPKKMGV